MFVSPPPLKLITLTKSNHILNRLGDLGYFIPLFMVCVFYTWKATLAPVGDFGNYYYGGKLLVNGLFDSHTYFPAHFNSIIQDFSTQITFLSFAPNSPFLALFFAPITWFSLSTAKLIFSIASLGLFLFSLLQLHKAYAIPNWFLVALPVIFLIPLKNQILFGQIYFLLFFLLIMGFIALKKEHWWQVSLWWGLAISLKVFPILLLGYLLFNGKTKAFVFTIFSTLMFIGFSLLITGWETWYFFFTEVLSRASSGEIAGEYVDNYQSFFMFLKRLLVHHPILNDSPFLPFSKLFFPLILMFKLFILFVLSILTWKIKKEWLTFSFWLFASLLFSAYGSTYSLLLLIPMAWASFQLKISYYFHFTFLLVMAIIANISVLPDLQFPLNYGRLLSCLGMATGLLWYYKKEIPLLKITSVVISAGILSFIFSSSPEKEPYATDFSMPILTYGYELKPNEISYNYWNQNGPQSQSIPYNSDFHKIKELKIIDSQIYYQNQPITSSSSNKRQARLINEHQILYLSDEGRGLGFYQLRKLYIEK